MEIMRHISTQPKPETETFVWFRSKLIENVPQTLCLACYIYIIIISILFVGKKNAFTEIFFVIRTDGLTKTVYRLKHV